ncbi:MAG: hypothetical protein TREMPRED_001100 [Tremellales sp. Tagirdzhanova-0007]|nr:MAG: hypothetical protein TREMPRED_001100 [Tremellales sp. Tagirdzhanova-0007]
MPTPSTSSPDLPVLIIGAGISGLLLAQGLKKHSIPFHIYEKDEALDARPQGYRIRLNLVGLHALRDALPKDVNDEVWRTAAKFVPGLGRVDAATGRDLGGPGLPPPPDLAPPSDPDPPVDILRSASSKDASPAVPADIHPDDPLTRLAMTSRLPVDRSILRAVLLAPLESHLTLSKRFDHYSITPQGVVAHFSDGTSVTGALLVGADGYNSRVTRQLLGPAFDTIKPIDMGPRMIYGKSPLTAALERDLNTAMRNGIRVALITDPAIPGPSLLIETCRYTHGPLPSSAASLSPSPLTMPRDYVFFTLASRDRFANTLTSDTCSNEAAAQIAERSVAHWDKSVRVVIEHQDRRQTSVWPMTCAPPNGLPAWKTERRVTILGDAVHPMPPTGGLAGNTAMRSAAWLVRVLARDRSGQRYGGEEEDVGMGSGERKGGRAADVGDDHGGTNSNEEDGTAGGGWPTSAISAYETRMRDEGGRMVSLAHAAATGEYPLNLWKVLIGAITGDPMEVIDEYEAKAGVSLV